MESSVRRTTNDDQAEVIDDGLSHLSDEDLKAIARYMNTRPAIENRIGN